MIAYVRGDEVLYGSFALRGGERLPPFTYGFTGVTASILSSINDSSLFLATAIKVGKEVRSCIQPTAYKYIRDWDDHDRSFDDGK